MARNSKRKRKAVEETVVVDDNSDSNHHQVAEVELPNNAKPPKKKRNVKSPSDEHDDSGIVVQRSNDNIHIDNIDNDNDDNDKSHFDDHRSTNSNQQSNGHHNTIVTPMQKGDIIDEQSPGSHSRQRENAVLLSTQTTPLKNTKNRSRRYPSRTTNTNTNTNNTRNDTSLAQVQLHADLHTELQSANVYQHRQKQYERPPSPPPHLSQSNNSSADIARLVSIDSNNSAHHQTDIMQTKINANNKNKKNDEKAAVVEAVVGTKEEQECETDDFKYNNAATKKPSSLQKRQQRFLQFLFFSSILTLVALGLYMSHHSQEVELLDLQFKAKTTKHQVQKNEFRNLFNMSQHKLDSTMERLKQVESNGQRCNASKTHLQEVVKALTNKTTSLTNDLEETVNKLEVSMVSEEEVREVLNESSRKIDSLVAETNQLNLSVTKCSEANVNLTQEIENAVKHIDELEILLTNAADENKSLQSTNQQEIEFRKGVQATLVTTQESVQQLEGHIEYLDVERKKLIQSRDEVKIQVADLEVALNISDGNNKELQSEYVKESTLRKDSQISLDQMKDTVQELEVQIKSLEAEKIDGVSMLKEAATLIDKLELSLAATKNENKVLESDYGTEKALHGDAQKLIVQKQDMIQILEGRIKSLEVETERLVQSIDEAAGKVLELQVSLTSSDGANKTLQSATEKESKLRKTVQANLLMTQGQVKQLEGQIAFLEADRIAMIASRELSQSRITELEMVLADANVEKKAFQSTSTKETDLRQRIQTDLLKTQEEVKKLEEQIKAIITEREQLAESKTNSESRIGELERSLANAKDENKELLLAKEKEALIREGIQSTLTETQEDMLQLEKQMKLLEDEKKSFIHSQATLEISITQASEKNSELEVEKEKEILARKDIEVILEETYEYLVKLEDQIKTLTEEKDKADEDLAKLEGAVLHSDESNTSVKSILDKEISLRKDAQTKADETKVKVATLESTLVEENERAWHYRLKISDLEKNIDEMSMIIDELEGKMDRQMMETVSALNAVASTATSMNIDKIFKRTESSVADFETISETIKAVAKAKSK